MIVKLNYDLLSYKKNSIIEIEKLPFKERGYFLKRLKDSKIDNCIEVVDSNKKKKAGRKKIIKE